jgi:hypothetical protein
MNISRETDHTPQPHTPTPDGFERRLRAWSASLRTACPRPIPGRRVRPQKRMALLSMRHGTASARLKRSGT